MAAQASAETLSSTHDARSRSVWTVLTVSSLAFLVFCGALAVGVTGFVTNVTIPNNATVELLQGNQLILVRYPGFATELITRTAELREGDLVSTGADSGAFATLFDGSTVRLYFSTTLQIKSLRTSRFFQNVKEANLHLDSGTLVFATSALGGYSSANYKITTNQAEIQVESGSKVRVTVEERNGQLMTSVIVNSGSATVFSNGKVLDLTPRNMAWVAGNSPPQGPSLAEEDLIRNGYFRDPPTSGAEAKENGGLGTAAWRPIREQSEEPIRDRVTASIITETLGGLGTINAVQILKEGTSDRYAKVGIHQEIHRPAEFLDTIELFATVKVLRQPFTIGGPQGNLFPLTISVNYSDADGVQREWKQHFYYVNGTPDPKDVRQVPHATWWSPRERFVLKSAQAKIGQDVAVINYIEIYGYGRQFQSWITGISMLAR